MLGHQHLHQQILLDLPTAFLMRQPSDICKCFKQSTNSCSFNFWYSAKRIAKGFHCNDINFKARAPFTPASPTSAFKCWTMAFILCRRKCFTIPPNNGASTSVLNVGRIGHCTRQKVSLPRHQF